jgi:PleD family two-component response regulator
VLGSPLSRITLEDEAGAADELADFSTVQYLVRAAHVLWPQTFRGIDPLTGVHDKQTFEGDLRAALEDAGKAGDIVSLVYCDIDAFKAVNDARGRPLKITSSFGVAAFPEDASNPMELARKADEALYLAKQGGRNRVVQAAEVSSRP